MATEEEPVILRCLVDLLWVPRHPVVDGNTGKVIRWQHGKIRLGQQFIWHGEPGQGYPQGSEVVSGPAVTKPAAPAPKAPAAPGKAPASKS